MDSSTPSLLSFFSAVLNSFLTKKQKINLKLCSHLKFSHSFMLSSTVYKSLSIANKQNVYVKFQSLSSFFLVSGKIARTRGINRSIIYPFVISIRWPANITLVSEYKARQNVCNDWWGFQVIQPSWCCLQLAVCLVIYEFQ